MLMRFVPEAIGTVAVQLGDPAAMPDAPLVVCHVISTGQVPPDTVPESVTEAAVVVEGGVCTVNSSGEAGGGVDCAGVVAAAP